MAYSNVGSSPRFYVNVLEWLASTGIITLPTDHFRTLPVNPTLFTNIYSPGFNWGIGEAFSQNCFFALLGHTRASDGAISLYLDPGGDLTSYSDDIQINVGTGNFSVPEYNGFSLASITQTDLYNMVLSAYGNVGSIILGTYYDIHSPELNLTMTREMGVKRIRTKGGADLVDYKYKRPAMWGDLGAWELHEPTIVSQYGDDPTTEIVEEYYPLASWEDPGANYQRVQELSRSGRRVWSLSFYLSAKDLNPTTASTTGWMTDPDVYSDWGTTGASIWDSGVGTDYDLYGSNDFYSQVIHKTNGGQLAFLFQPDRYYRNPDGFAICKFDMKEFKCTQVFNEIFKIKLKIKEVW